MNRATGLPNWNVGTRSMFATIRHGQTVHGSRRKKDARDFSGMNFSVRNVRLSTTNSRLLFQFVYTC